MASVRPFLYFDYSRVVCRNTENVELMLTQGKLYLKNNVYEKPEITSEGIITITGVRNRYYHVHNSSSQDFWTNFAKCGKKLAKFGLIRKFLA